jgi:O-succinylbenzoic acid--CoA ligase
MSELTLPSAIRLRVAAEPLGVAVRDHSGEIACAALERAMEGAAAAFLESGVVPGERVALLAAASGAALAVLAGILRVGAVAVPLGTRLTRREVGDALAETYPTLVVHDASLAAAARGHGVPTLALDDLAGRAAGTCMGPVLLDQDAPAVAILTSGTSGRPKAALLSHRALAASAAAWTEALPPARGWLLCLGLGHVAGLGVVWRALGGGLPLTIVAPDEPAAPLEALAGGTAAPSHLSLVPTQLARLLDAAGDAPSPADLRAVLVGGAPIPAELVRRALAAGWPIVPTYGLTEAGSGVTALRTPEAAEAAARPGSAGRPLPGVELRIAAAGRDGLGEIEVRTPAAFSGYLGRPAETAAAFTEDGWLRTGDLGRLDEAGRLVVVDRRTDLLISGGENVYPAEVEAVLASHPAVAEAGVAGRPDPTWGAVPVAGLVLRPGAADPGDARLRAWCAERLARHKVPAAFRRLEALPLTASGKLRRSVLRDLLTPFVVVLHATLSTGRQIAPLVRALAASGDLRVVAPDRLGSGERRLDPPRPVTVDEHVADLAALLEGEGVERTVLVGHSFGGVLAVEAAARLPERVLAVVAYEPIYGPVGGPVAHREIERVARATRDAFAAGGTPAAARAFLARIAGPSAWQALPERTQRFLEDEGGSAVADVDMIGLDPAGLERIACPVTIVTGGSSEPFYALFADALAARLPDARRVELAGLRHAAPVTDAVAVSVAVREALALAGVVALSPEAVA